MKNVFTADRPCALFEHGTGGPVILWGTSDPFSMQSAAETAAALCSDAPFTLLAYPAASWNDDFSPWPAPPVFGKDGFAGHAQETLHWLTDCCLPALPDGPKLIGGYSLAGLFSLWALYTCSAFQGACSCSGSLWYPGWSDFARNHHAPQDSIVYLSLGDREEKTRSRTMAAVGDATRRQNALLQDDPAIRESVLVWHPGGHFDQPGRRMAEGIAWLARRCT